MRKMWTYLLVASVTLSLAVWAYGLGADYPANQPVTISVSPPPMAIPPGVNDLINQGDRIHGYWDNDADRFYYVGNTTAFETFLKQYEALDRILGHRLIIHGGKGQASSPWGLKERKACDWMLDVALVKRADDQWIDTSRKVYRDPEAVMAKLVGTEEPKWMVELHVWVEGNVDIETVSIPKDITVVRDDRVEPKKDETTKQKSKGHRK